jgi:hypothetical protein
VYLLALLVVVSPLSFKKVRTKIVNWFSNKDIHDRLHNQDEVIGEVVKATSVILKELTQNGGEGGKKDSTMKDNIGLALREIAAVKIATDQNSKTVAEMDTNLGKVTVEVAEMRGQLSVINPSFARS